MIDQLEILINSNIALKSLHGNTNSQAESEKLNRLAIRILCSNTMRAENQSTATNSTVIKNLFAVENCEHAVRIVRSLRVFFYTSPKSAGAEHFANLSNSMNEILANPNSTLVQQQIACQTMTVLLGSLNNNPFEGCFYGRPRHDYLEMMTHNRTTSIQLIDQMMLALNNRNCKLITDVTTKSFVYQSMNQALRANEALALKVASFFSTMLDKYLIRTAENNSVHFNLRSCVSDDFRLIEPVDVLFHCAIVCINSSAMIGIGGSLFMRLNQVLQSYLDREAGFMFNIYRKQFADLVEKHQAPHTAIHVLYSLEFGLLDACIDHLISTDNYNKIAPLLTKYEVTTALMSAEIEDLMAPKPEPVPKKEPPRSVINTRKRKLESTMQSSNSSTRNAPLVAGKKLKKQIVDKENQPPAQVQTAQVKVLRGRVLENIQNIQPAAIQKPSEHKPPQESVAPTTSKKASEVEVADLGSGTIFGNILANHTHRISYKCCMKMINLCIGSGDTALTRASHVFTSTMLESTIKIIQNEKFQDFVIKLTEKKLNALSDTDRFDVYDPEGLDSDDIFRFLTIIWRFVL
jgi:hypothetical protein